MQNLIIIFIHIMAAGIGLGSMVYCILFLLPALEKLPAKEIPDQMSLVHKILDVLAPTVFVSLMVLIASGIYYLMVNYTAQVNLTSDYYNLFGVKMIFVIIAFFISVYQTFTLRGRIANLDLSPENKKEVPATLKQMKTLSHIMLAGISVAVFMGLWLARTGGW